MREAPPPPPPPLIRGKARRGERRDKGEGDEAIGAACDWGLGVGGVGVPRKLVVGFVT